MLRPKLKDEIIKKYYEYRTNSTIDDIDVSILRTFLDEVFEEVYDNSSNKDFDIISPFVYHYNKWYRKNIMEK